MGSQTIVTTLEVVPCARCAINFGVPARFDQDRRADHTVFYCPVGHPNHYPHKSTAEQLRDQLAAAQSREDQLRARLRSEISAGEHLLRRVAATKGALTKVKKRVGHGVCPCCTRTFQNVARHMATKHPEYSGEGAP